MVWVRLDDKFMTHSKIVRAGKDARDLYLAGLLYSSGNLTDGFLPAESIPILAVTALVEDVGACVERLISLRLWEAAEDGYAIHDYLDYNPSAEQVKRERQAASDRMRRIRSPEVRPNNTRSSPEVRQPGTRVRPGYVPGTSPELEVLPAGESPGGDARAEPAAASAAPPTIRAVPKSKPANGASLAPLLEAFAALGLPRPALGDPAEQHAAAALIRGHPPPDLAACWQDIAAGDWGDAYDQSHLSFLHLSKHERVANWRRWKNGGQPNGRRGNPKLHVDHD